MIRVAVPNGGKYAKRIRRSLALAGYKQRQVATDLGIVDEANQIDFYYLEPRDIPTYVGSGDLHLGFASSLLADESGASIEDVLALDFEPQTFYLAGPLGSYRSVRDLEGRSIATKFPRVVRAHLARHQIRAHIIKLDGGVSVAVGLGLADAIADVFKTDWKLRANNLHVIGDAVLVSRAHIIKRQERPDRVVSPQDEAKMEEFVRRVRAVLHARKYVMLDYDCPVSLIDDAKRITPGAHSPTLSQVLKPDWYALRVMISSADVVVATERLRRLGCDAIVTSKVNYCEVADSDLAVDE